jgi:glycosyltransferase involved in cell wall biosynthesis
MLKKLAIVTTHPIQYNAPLFALLASRNKISIRVFYTWGKQVLEQKFDPGFGKKISWDIPLIEGYDYCFVENTSANPGSHHRKGIQNPGLIPEIEKWQPNAVLVYGWNFSSHIKALRYFHKKIPVLFRGDSTMLDLQNPVKAMLKKIYLTNLFKHIDIALYAGSENKKYYQNFGLPDNHLAFMPHAVDNQFFYSNKKPAIDFREKLDIPNEDTVFLFAGKFIEKKNPVALVMLFAALKLSNTHLVMAGNGPLEDQLKLAAVGNNHIHFVPFQNQSAMPSLYAMCDCFILPSKGPGETWGLAVNEAMAAGKAILVSNKCGCAADLLENGKNGFIFNAENCEDLEKNLKRITGSKKLMAEMGVHSLEKIKNWSLQNAAIAIEKAVTGF